MSGYSTLEDGLPRKLEEALEFQTANKQAELLDLAHEAIAAKRLRETSEERQEELRSLLKRKIGKKGFAGEALASNLLLTFTKPIELATCVKTLVVSAKLLSRRETSKELYDDAVRTVYQFLE